MRSDGRARRIAKLVLENAPHGELFNCYSVITWWQHARMNYVPSMMEVTKTLTRMNLERVNHADGLWNYRVILDEEGNAEPPFIEDEHVRS